MNDHRRLVYSSDGGRQISDAGRERAGNSPVGKVTDGGVIRVSRERRRASSVTMVSGLAAGQVSTVTKVLKTLCATGGTAKHGRVELQGDHRDKVIAYFKQHNRKAKRAGG